MKIVITSDIQLHPHQQWSKPLPNGMNDRLQDGLNCLDQAFSLCGSDGLLIVDGDLFHDRKSLALDTIYHTVELFKKWSKVKALLAVGNHDQFLRDGEIHSLVVCNSGNVTIADKPTILTHGGVTLHVIPFFEDVERFKQEVSGVVLKKGSINILLMHQGVDGASLAGNSKARDKICLGDLRLKEFDLVLSGHYHRPQQMAENFFYIGSPYEIDEGEAGDVKRILVLSDSVIDGEAVWENPTCKLYSVPTKGVPQHITFDSIEDYEASPRSKERHFVTVRCKDDAEVREGVQKGLRVKVVDTEEVKDTPDVEGELTPASAMEAFLKSRNREDLLAEARTRAKC